MRTVPRTEGTKTMAQSVKCLLCKKEDMSVDIQNPLKDEGTVICDVTQLLQGQGRGMASKCRQMDEPQVW